MFKELWGEAGSTFSEAGPLVVLRGVKKIKEFNLARFLSGFYGKLSDLLFDLSQCFFAKSAVWKERLIHDQPPHDLAVYLKLRSDEQPSEGDMVRVEAVLHCANEKGYPDAPLPKDGPQAVVGGRCGPLDGISQVKTNLEVCSVTV